MSISDFIYNYFILPYKANQGYNLVNSLAYGLLLVGVLYLINKILNRYNFKIKEKLVLSILPFILFGSTVRVLEDARILPQTFLLVTPGIYFIIMGITSAVLVACHKYTRKPEKNVFLIGNVLALGALLFFRMNNWEGFIVISTIFIAILLFLGILRKRTRFLKDNLNFLGVAAHMLDATATFVTLDLFKHLGYWEQHPVTRFVGTVGGSFLWFYILKLFVVLVLYWIDRDVKDKNMKTLLKFAVIVLGLAPGIRDTLRLAMLV
jgi:uncharacterized membrane protein